MRVSTTGERFERAVQIMARLRAPDGCPWDREQTFDSIKPYTLEETYEVLEAIDDRENYDEERVNLIGMCEGILLHVTYTERGERVRIISARRAEKHEQNNYYRANTR